MGLNNLFIYVFNHSARDELLKLGAHLLKSDENNHIYVFENCADLQNNKRFSNLDISISYSNTLTF